MSEPEECEHIKQFRAYLESHGIRVWGEFTEDPDGWVNVECEACKVIHEISLQKEQE